MNTTTLEIGQTLVITGQAVTIESIKGRWVKLSNGANISRADATEARQAFLDAEAAKTADATGYTGPMLALRERAKRGLYQKAANGQPSCGDEVAQILGALAPTQVIRTCILALNLEGNPYTHLNIGQQSMNLRNKLRGALTRGEFGMGVVREAAEEVIEFTANEVRMAAKIKGNTDNLQDTSAFFPCD